MTTAQCSPPEDGKGSRDSYWTASGRASKQGGSKASSGGVRSMSGEQARAVEAYGWRANMESTKHAAAQKKDGGE